MASPTPPLALSPPSLAVLQTRNSAQPNHGQPQEQPQSGSKNPGQAPAALVAGGRGRLVDILV